MVHQSHPTSKLNNNLTIEEQIDREIDQLYKRIKGWYIFINEQSIELFIWSFGVWGIYSLFSLKGFVLFIAGLVLLAFSFKIEKYRKSNVTEPFHEGINE